MTHVFYLKSLKSCKCKFPIFFLTKKKKPNPPNINVCFSFNININVSLQIHEHQLMSFVDRLKFLYGTQYIRFFWFARSQNIVYNKLTCAPYFSYIYYNLQTLSMFSFPSNLRCTYEDKLFINAFLQT